MFKHIPREGVAHANDKNHRALSRIFTSQIGRTPQPCVKIGSVKLEFKLVKCCVPGFLRVHDYSFQKYAISCLSRTATSKANITAEMPRIFSIFESIKHLGREKLSLFETQLGQVFCGVC
jgi:hypothetical protein